MALLLATLLVLPSFTVPALGAEVQGYQNPSLEETARKLEVIARSKQIPSAILKVIAFCESGWRQFDKNGNVVIGKSSSNPSLGIMQITSYNASDNELVEKLKYDIEFNIAYGADLLNAKWDMVPKIGDGDRNKLENWYFALWAYNSWSAKNNPNDAAASGKVAYQDAIIRRAATEYYQGVVTPVQITPMDPKLFPQGTIPKKDQKYETPETFTLGDLRVGTGADPSRGGVIGTVTRIFGKNRIDTVNEIALKGWPHGSDTVVITRSDTFPDALAGVPLAKKYNAPILITKPDELDPEVVQVLKTLKPLKAIILGGEGAISKDVEEELKQALSWTNDIVRIAGSDRYETAALIAEEFPQEGNVALATGMDFPDALSLASAAAAQGIPLLLTAPNQLPEVTRAKLEELLPRGLYVAGGEAAVSGRVVEEAARTVGIAEENIHRFAGQDRYDTSVKIAETFYPRTEEIFLATGRDFSDPLAAGALAAARNSALLLVSPEGFALESATENYLKKMPASTNVQVIGGTGSITEDTVNQAKYLLKQI